MSFQSQIPCPDCGHLIYLETTLLVSGAKFTCSNSSCGVSISLSSEDRSTVANTLIKYQSLKDLTVK